jgi:hypothetical protein
LGDGADGVFGDVELVVRRTPLAGQAIVEWGAGDAAGGDHVRGPVTRAAEAYLKAYVECHPGLGIAVVIASVASDPNRRNDFERAVKMAFWEALSHAGLPVPQIFAAPDDGA